ncbi:hypothetical protein CH75_04965 [Dyella jiangningensis]|nr:hypothetical protein CH75_04965 [Dyella jiangningensis]
MLSSKYFTWCEKSVLVLLLAIALISHDSLYTIAFYQRHGLDILKACVALWLFLRVVDMIFCLPDRRAAKRHLDAIEKKWGKF